MLTHLKRCCWLTWVVAVLVGLAVTLIGVPGEYTTPSIDWNGAEQTGWSKRVDEATKRRYAPDKLGPRERIVVDQYQHGWPLPCLTRGVGRVVLRPGGNKELFVRGHKRTQPRLSVRLPSDGDSFTTARIANSKSFKLVPVDWEGTPILWSDYLRWPLVSDAAEWRFDYLAVNLAVLLAIPLAAALATEGWVRRRGSAVRFRLVDLFFAVTICSLVLAWRQSHMELRRVEQQIESQASAFWFFFHSLQHVWEDRQRGNQGYNGYHREHFGPDWLGRLLGNQEFLRFSKHIVAVQVVPNERWRANVALLPRLDYLELVSLPTGATREAIDQLKSIPRLRKLQIDLDPPAAKTKRGADADGAAHDWIGPQDLAILRSLPIEELGLAGEELLIEDIEEVVSISTLKRLELVQASITREELERTRKSHPHVEITCAWGQEGWSRFSVNSFFRFDQTPPRNIERRIESIKQRRAEALAGNR